MKWGKYSFAGLKKAFLDRFSGKRRVTEAKVPMPPLSSDRTGETAPERAYPRHERRRASLPGRVWLNIPVTAMGTSSKAGKKKTPKQP